MPALVTHARVSSDGGRNRAPRIRRSTPQRAATVTAPPRSSHPTRTALHRQG